MGTQLGLTFHSSSGLDLSIALGKDAKSMRIDPETGDETAKLTTIGAGIFLDRNGSLLASVHFSEVLHRLVKVNVYPGVLDRNFGAWAVVTRDLEVRFGLSHRQWLGAGLGFGR